MSSTAFDVTTIGKALGEASVFITQALQEEESIKLEEGLRWQAVEPGSVGHAEQVHLLRRLPAIRADLLADKFPELKAWASWHAEVINQKLAEHGFSIRLNPWPYDRQTFGVAAIYDWLGKWLVKGVEKTNYGEPYQVEGHPAYRLGAKDAKLEFYDVGQSEPLVRIPTQGGDYVCVAKAEGALAGFDLLAHVEERRRRLWVARQLYDWGGVIAPNILLSQEVDISWLINLWTQDPTGTPWWVQQAKMEVKFAMGPEGARAKVAAAIAVMRGGFTPDHIIDYDVVIWIDRPMVSSVPLLSLYVPKSEFANRTVGLNEI